MFSFNLSRWLKSWLTRRRGRPIVNRPRYRLSMEELETRLAPSVTWIGTASSNWSNAANWQGGILPTAGADVNFQPNTTGATITATDNINVPLDSITFLNGSNAGYVLTSAAPLSTLTLGSTSASPFIKDHSGASDIISMNIAINGSMSGTNNLEVDTGSTLTFQGGALSGTSQLDVQGGGTLILNQANTFTGSFTINNDSTIVEMMNGAALGDAANPVSVGNNSEIQVSGGITAPYNIQLAGLGTQSNATSSPLMSTAGNNVWTGSITFQTNVNSSIYFYVPTAGTTFTIDGVIYDSGAVGNLYKWGPGELVLANANQYRGETDIENGFLTVEDPLALGPSPTQTVYTHIDPILGTGTLNIEYTGTQTPNDSSPTTLADYILQDPTQPHNAASNPYVGFLMDYQLVLISDGYLNNGSLYNSAGDNAWSGPISLVSSNNATVTINVNASSELDITAVIANQNAANILTKSGTGNLILEPTQNANILPADAYALITLNDGTTILSQDGANGNSSQGVANTFDDQVNILAGIVTLEDSQGLGLTTKIAMTTVSSGASLHLVGNVGHEDSVTDTSNELLLDAPLTINGTGFGTEGALDSISGINRYVENPSFTTAGGIPADIITIGAADTYIGVDPDPTETASNAYFTNDYSLTISGGLINSSGYSNLIWIAKVGGGQLILPNANTNFYGSWEIQQGWITVQDQDSLGGTQNGIFPNFNQGAEFNTYVDSGAALMLLPFNPNSNMSLGNTNLILQGEGISHAFPLIDNMGAVENLSGVNTIAGNITLEGQVGIGVEEIYPGTISDLTLSGGQISQANATPLFNRPGIPAAITIPNTLAAAGVSQYTQVVDTGSTNFSGTINYANFIGDRIQVYYGPIGTPGSHLLAGSGVGGLADTGAITGSGTLTFNDNAAIGDSTEIEIVVDQDNSLQTLAGVTNGTSNVTGLASTSQLYVGELVAGANIPAGDTIASINANGTAITLASAATTSASESLTFGNATWNYNGSVTVDTTDPGYFVGGIIKVGSQRLVLEGEGISEGGVDIRQGVVFDNNDNGLGQPEYNTGIPGQMFGTTVEAGAGLMLEPTLATLNGGLSVGPAVWANHLTLNGTGNSTFGVAPLTLLSEDNLWSGPISLNTAVSITYQGTLANTTLPANPVTVNFAGLTGAAGAFDPTIDAATTTAGSAGVDDVETLTFGGTFGASAAGNQFTMTVWDGVHYFTTGNILWNPNPHTLIANIQAALALDPNLASTELLFSVVSPTIDISPNSRLIVLGNIDDNSGPVVGDNTASALSGGSDLYIAGGGELDLSGADTYQGTTYVSQGTLTLGNSNALGATGTSATQSLALTNAIAGHTYFKLSFGAASTGDILYTGTAADAVAIQTALGNLAGIGAANVAVTQANPGVFLIAFSGTPASSGTILSPSIDTVASGASGAVTGTTIVAGTEGGTEVADNAQIQLQGGITVNNEPLVVQGQGSNREPTVQTFTVGGNNAGNYSATFNGQTYSGINYSDSAAQIQADLQGLSSVGGAGGQVSVTETSISGGNNDQQQLVINSTVTNQTTFQLTFGPTAYDPNIYTTGNITYDAADFNVTAINIYTALDGLNDIGGISPVTGLAVGGITSVSGSIYNGGQQFTITFLGGLGDTPGLPTINVVGNTAITTTHLRYGSLPTKTYQVVFLGSFAGTSEPALTAAAVSGGATVSPPTITLTGGTANATPNQWFSNFQGTGNANSAINNVQVYNSDTTTLENASGSVVSVCVDASDPDVIYIATASGGAWKTEDGGLTWVPLFDAAFELANPAVMFGGVITQDPNHVNILYYGTGQDADSPDSYYGTGVYESTNDGGSWNLLVGAQSNAAPWFSNTPLGLGNPFAGMTIGSIIANPEQTGSVVVTANYSASYGDVGGLASGLNNGIWEYDGTNWIPILVQGNFTENGTTTQATETTETGTLTNGSPTVTGLSDTTPLLVGEEVSGTGIPVGTTILSIDSMTQVTLTNNATVTGSEMLTFSTGPYTNIISNIVTTNLYLGMFVSCAGCGLPAGTTITDIGPDAATGLAANSIALSNDPTLPQPPVSATYPFIFTTSPLADWANDNFSSLVYEPGGPLMVAISSLDGGGSPDFGIYTTQINPAPLDFFAGTGGGPWIFSNNNGFNMGEANQFGSSGTPILPYVNSYATSGTIMLAGNGGSYYAGISAVGTFDGQLFDVQSLGTGSWAGVADSLTYGSPDLDNIPNYMGFAGWYANAIADFGTDVFVGGTDANLGGFVLMSSDYGATWSIIAEGGATPTIDGPFTGVRSLEATSTTLYAATDGGLWTYDIASGTWSDITGNLGNAQFVSASADPSNPDIALASGHSIGAAQYNVSGATGTQTWSQVTGAAGTIGGNTAVGINGYSSLGGQIEYDPANPADAWFYEAGNLMLSTDANSPNPTFTSMLATAAVPVVPFALDPNNSQRVVVGDTNLLEETTNLGASWSSLSSAASYPAINITSLAIADFQGQYQADPSFANLPDNPPNTVDSSTIYITNGSGVYVTKNGGVSWSGNRAPSIGNTTIAQLVVDPADRDTVFAVTIGTSGSNGTGHVFESTNAGQTWTDITGGVNGLADASVWTLAIDPRNSNIYVGTETGVCELAGGQLTGANNWVRFGAGLPFVQVRDIEINTNANTLTIATYGRGMYQYYLDDTQADAGAFRR